MFPATTTIGQLARLSGGIVTLALVFGCSKKADTASCPKNGAYVLNLPSLNQADRIEIQGAKWIRSVTDDRSGKVIFSEGGAVVLSVGGDLTLEGFTMKVDCLKPARETVEIAKAYSVNLKVYVDDNVSPPAIVYDDEYGYVYLRVREP